MKVSKEELDEAADLYFEESGREPSEGSLEIVLQNFLSNRLYKIVEHLIHDGE